MNSVKEEVLVRVRLQARHGQEPYSRQALKEFCRLGPASPEEVREAERQGRALLASGAQCLCPECEANLRGLDHNERLRIHYAARRHSQLQAQGVESRAERERLIQAEIDAGAALQAAPVRITRTGRQP